MKPLERIFFQACVMQRGMMSVREIIAMFCALGFSEKQLLCYVDKWDKLGFYEYGVTLDLGWFYIDKLTGEYKVMYERTVEKGGGLNG